MPNLSSKKILELILLNIYLFNLLTCKCQKISYINMSFTIKVINRRLIELMLLKRSWKYIDNNILMIKKLIQLSLSKLNQIQRPKQKLMSGFTINVSRRNTNDSFISNKAWSVDNAKMKMAFHIHWLRDIKNQTMFQLKGFKCTLMRIMKETFKFQKTLNMIRNMKAN